MTKQEAYKIIMEMDFPSFCETFLKVVDEKGNLVPFILNPAQMLVHERLEKHKEKYGFVRALVPKARKLGMSTMIAARFFRAILLNPNNRCLVLSATQPDSKVLFDKYRVFYDNLPEWMKPLLEVKSTIDLKFDTGSSLRCVTAGAKGSARGDTAQYMHCSEITSWANQQETISGALNTVAMVEGTELIIESTAKGRGDEYFRMWSNAIAGNSIYEPIFLPWNLDPRYVMTPPKGFKLTVDEHEYAEMWNLSMEQMYWRSIMIADKGEFMFQQEFPITPSDCFNVIDTDALISTEAVQRARKCSQHRFSTTLKAPLIIGVDVARYGSDKTVICFRRGRVVERMEEYAQYGSDQILHIVKNHMEKEKPDSVNIDSSGGYGGTIVDILRADGYDNVRGIEFGSKAPNTVKFANMRAYMYSEIKDWLDDEPAKLPDNEYGDKLEGDLTSITYKFDNKSRLMLEKKSEIKKRLGHSPDYSDALALTFARKISSLAKTNNIRSKWDKMKKEKGSPYL